MPDFKVRFATAELPPFSPVPTPPTMYTTVVNPRIRNSLSKTNPRYRNSQIPVRNN